MFHILTDADQDLGASSGSPKFSGGSHHVLGDEYGADGESDEGKYVFDEYDPFWWPLKY